MQKCGKFQNTKNRIIFMLICITIIMLLTSCRRLPATKEYEEKIQEIVHVTGGVADTDGYHVMIEEEIIENYLKDKGAWTEAEDGFRWEAMICDTDVYRADIITDDDGTFNYRNVKYDIQSWIKDNYIIYQLPGECRDYYVRFWMLE